MTAAFSLSTDIPLPGFISEMMGDLPHTGAGIETLVGREFETSEDVARLLRPEGITQALAVSAADLNFIRNVRNSNEISITDVYRVLTFHPFSELRMVHPVAKGLNLDSNLQWKLVTLLGIPDEKLHNFAKANSLHLGAYSHKHTSKAGWVSEYFECKLKNGQKACGAQYKTVTHSL